MTLIQRFARFATDLTLADIPERVADKIRLQVMTSLSAARMSHWHPEAAKVLAAKKAEYPGRGSATLFAGGGKLPSEAAAYVNAAYAMSLDFDDYMLMGHTGYSAVITPLAFLEETDGTTGDLVLAAAAANEVIGRMSSACFFGPLNGQMTSYIHNIGAALSTARARSLGEAETANSMAIALYQPNFSLVPGFWHEGAKLLTASTPVQAGISAARMAENGLSGPLDIIEGHLGFFHFFSFRPLTEFLGGLGHQWLSDTLSYKRYPGTSYIGAPVDAAIAAAVKLGVSPLRRPDLVREIIINTTFLSYGLEKISLARGDRPLTPMEINFSVRYSAAYALLMGNLAPGHFRPEEIAQREKDIRALAEKIRVEHDWDMTEATVKSFPMALSLISSTTPAEIRRIAEHMRAINPGGPSVDSLFTAVKEFLTRFAGPGLLERILTIGKSPPGIGDMDFSRFRMLQSARAQIRLVSGERAESGFPIPRGGAGIDLEERKAWVFERFESAFGRDPQKAFDTLRNPDAPVSELVRACMGGGKAKKG